MRIMIKRGKGYYAPCVPELIDVMGSEIGAVVLQTVLCGVLGMGFEASSMIWEIEHWSLVKQTGIYFLIISVIMMPTAYFTYWMEHSVMEALSYFGIFVLIFVVIWVVQFGMGRRNVERMNEELNKVKKEEN